MDEMYELIQLGQQKYEMQGIIACNEKTKKFGLVLTEEEVKSLMVCRKDSLKENQRIEFGEGILADLIYAFCDSQYLSQDNYVDTLAQLQEIFYLYKNESQDELTDAELIDFMRNQFEEICFGDVEYLRGTCLERFARAIRSGYQCQAQRRLRDEYTLKDVENEYNKLSEETRWDYEVYKMKLEDMY
ncbi:MAG: hypothetical protein CVU84_03930 [Firmicutes bacterium HGW-Firmicutes-1]|jgi:hypothetical protein|nr:MAG: hypothetical protein CVU84_03930 [Firmicutes bacterium HGW-Firmicutes-1]